MELYYFERTKILKLITNQAKSIVLTNINSVQIENKTQTNF